MADSPEPRLGLSDGLAARPAWPYPRLLPSLSSPNLPFPMKRHSFRRLAAALQLFATANLVAQDFRIDRVRLDPGGRLEVTFPAQASRYYRLLEGAQPGATATPVSIGLQGPLTTPGPVTANAGFYRVEELDRTTALDTDGDGRDDVAEILAGTRPLERDTPPADITTVSSSPSAGESEVAVTRETVLRFSRPLAADTTLSAAQLYASFGQRRLLTRVELAADRRSATLFYLEPIPASARIRVSLDGSAVRDVAGKAVDADGDGEPGGLGLIEFDTVSVTPVGTTGVVGRVFASELVNGLSLNRPLAGVTITVDGAEESLRAVTDANGNFRLQPAPAGTFFVHVDGRTAEGSQWPGGAYYPFVGKAWDAVAGKSDNLAGGTGEIYLPFVRTGTLQPVSATAETRIEFPAEVVAANPDLAGVNLLLPPNALFADSGARGGRVGIAPVSPDRLPEPLPSGLNFPLVITVQTDGGSNFDRPVPVTFPNLPDPITGEKLPPGAKSALWSFDHDLGSWVINGPMTVNADGKFLVCDPGTGIREPGWHGTQPGTSLEGGPIEAECEPTGCVMGPILVRRLGGGRFQFELESEARTPGIVNWFAGTASNAQALAGNLVEFTFCEPGLHNLTAQVSPKCGDPCSKSITVTVGEDEIPQTCDAGSAIVELTYPAGQEVRLGLVFIESEPPPEEITWEVTGATPARGTGLDFKFTFCTPGPQTVRWTRTPPCGEPCSHSATVTVEATEACSLGEMVSLGSTSIAAGDAVAVVTQAGQAGTVTWSVTDGTLLLDAVQRVGPGGLAGLAAAQTIEFCTPGTKTITASLLTDCGRTCVRTLVVNVTGASGCTLAPFSLFGSTTLPAGDTVSLVTTATQAGTVVWSAEDGELLLDATQKVGQVGIAGLGAAQTIQFCTPGTKTVTARLTTGCGETCEQTATFVVTVNPCNFQPIELFGTSATITAGGVVAPVTTCLQAGQFVWEAPGGQLLLPASQRMGPDGVAGFGAAQTIQYDQPGTYTIRGTLTTDCNEACTRTVTITVLPATAPAPAPGAEPHPTVLAWQRAAENAPDSAVATPAGPQRQAVTTPSVRQTGLHYYVLVNPATGAVVRRGFAGRNGVAHARPLIVGANRSLREIIVQADSFWLASQDFRTGENGSSLTLGAFRLEPPAGPDTDGDGVPDEVEFVVGTDPTKADSDGDGIGDAEEIRVGTALADTLGVIAAVRTPGYALDVAADGDRLAVALREGGVAVFNIFSGLTPARIAQVALPGRATAVALAGDTVVVGCGDAGVALVDVSDPAAASVRHQVRFPGPVRSVAARAGLGYVGLNSGEVLVLDLVTGSEIARSNLGQPVHDLSLTGEFLYALTDQQVAAYQLASGGLEFRGSAEAKGSVGAGQRRLRLFAGGDRAYAVDTSGFRVFSLSLPEQPRLLQHQLTTQFGWKQLVPDGAGLGLAAVDANSTDDGAHDISLYELQPAGTNAVFGEAFVTPGIAEAVTLAAGLGYVADGAEGLQVVRFRRRDTSGRAPSVTLRSPFADGVAEENKPATFRADATDDVQLSRVEFLLDGVVVGTDTSFPYELRLTTPARSATRTSFRLQARAVDTGGNSALSAELNLNLVGDATPPGIARLTPGSFAFTDSGPVDRVGVTFAEAVDAASVKPELFEIRHAGADFSFGTADDLVIAGARFSYRPDTFTALLVLDTLLPRGAVQVTMKPGVADLKGNARPEPLVWQFNVGGPRVVSTTPSGGSTSAGRLLEARFNGPVNPATLTGRFTLTAAGPDVRLGTADDVAITGGVVAYDAETYAAQLSFATPLPTGLYRAQLAQEVADAAGNTLGGVFRWDFSVANGTVTPGQPAAFVVSLGGPGAVAELAVTLPAGQPISFFAPADFGDCAAWNLIGPSGETVFTDRPLCRHPEIFRPLFAGEYVLRARSEMANGGRYRVTVALHTERRLTASLVGQDRFEQSAGARVPGDVDVWDLDLPPGETFAFSASGSGPVFATLTDLAGRTLLEQEPLLNRFAVPDTRLGGRFRLVVVPTATTGYQLRLIRNQTRNYEIDLRGKSEFTSTDLPDGNANTRVPGDVDRIGFTITPGERWVFLPESPFPCFNWSLGDVFGRPVFASQGMCDGFAEADTTAGGNFTLRLGLRDNATGGYRFRARRVVEQTFTHDLRGGRSLQAAGTLAATGSSDTYRLQFDAGTEVRFLLDGSCFEWELVAPAGGVDFPLESTCNGPKFTTPVAGEYRLRIRAGSFQSGDYQLEIRPLTGLRIAADLRPAGSRFERTVDPISLTPPADHFTFQLAGGTAYRARVEGDAPVRWRVLDADANILGEIPATAQWQELFTPATDAVLRLELLALVEDRYTLRVEPVPQAPGRWLPGDTNTPLDKIEAGVFHQGALHLAGRRYRPGQLDEVVLLRQNGTQWNQLGTFESFGFFRGRIETNSGFALALLSDGSDLVVGGRFTRVNGVHAPLVARWDGTTWHALADPASAAYVPQSSDTVFALTRFKGELLAGGDFDQLASPASTRYAARWNGTTWRQLGNGLSGGFRLFNGAIAGNVFSFAPQGEQLFLGGVFTAPSPGVVAWDGTNLVATPGIFDPDFNDAPYVAKLIPQSGRLLAAGNFFVKQDGTNLASQLAAWDGASWTNVPGAPPVLISYGDGATDAVGAIYHGEDLKLGAGGTGAESNGLFRWDGAGLTALHNGVLREELRPFHRGGESFVPQGRIRRAEVNEGDLLPERSSGRVETVFSHEGRIYVLGEFHLAGPERVRNWAVWEPAAANP